MDFHDLSIRDLLAVTAVADHEHFGRAASALRVPQPTLSAQVQKVERTLGVSLFERTSRRFLVTPEGQRLLPLLREALAAAERVGAAAHRTGGAGRGTSLKLGVIPTLGAYIMPHLLLPMSRRLPEFELNIIEQPTAQLVEALRDGTLDAALLSVPVRHPTLDAIPLFDEPFRLIAKRGSTILGVDHLSPGLLCVCDMILLEDGHCLRDQAIEVCGKHGGISPRMVTTSLETLKYLVAAGQGYSLIPAMACDVPKGLTELVQFREFDEGSPLRRIGLCLRRTHTRRSELETLAAVIRRHLPTRVRQVDANG